MFAFVLLESDQDGIAWRVLRRFRADSLADAQRQMSAHTFGRPHRAVQSEASYNLGQPKALPTDRCIGCGTEARLPGMLFGSKCRNRNRSDYNASRDRTGMKPRKAALEREARGMPGRR